MQHALPVTFGLKLAGTLDALLRWQQRLREMRPRLLVLQFGGAAGPQARAAPLLYLSSHRWVPRFFSVTATGRRETYLLFHTWVCSMRLATRCRSFALSTASICR